jgi:two-component system KDP operon response regulator KdpE
MRRFLRITLQSQGYRLIESESGRDGLLQASSRNPDVILLDLGLPDMDGLDVTERLREWAATPIIVISAREQEQDKVKALDAGADDYLTKPFSAGELLARIRVALRHALRQREGRQDPVFILHDLRVDLARRQVFLAEREIHLTPIEYKLLITLIRHAGKVVTHRQLLQEVWGPAHVNEVQYLRVYMTQLRHKLEADPTRPRFFLNEPGVGYRLKDEPE